VVTERYKKVMVTKKGKAVVYMRGEKRNRRKEDYLVEARAGP